MAATEDQAREAVLRLEEWRRLAPHSLAAHSALVHRDDRERRLVPARHHREWVRILQDRERYPFVCIVAPPGYAKSTWASVAYPTWRIGALGGKVRIGLVCNTATQAEAFSGAVQASIQSPAFYGAYGLEPDWNRGWSRAQFYVTGTQAGPNPTMLATGIGGPVLGKRFDEIILDDPTTWAEARSDVTMRGQRHWLRSTLLRRLPPGMRPPDGQGGRVVAIMTRWSTRDLYQELVELGFQTLVMPALGYWAEDEPLWPEKETREQLLHQREQDELIFELVMQGNPEILSGDVFDAAWFQRGIPPLRDECDMVVAYVDTSSGKQRQRGDYFAMMTVGIKGDQVWMLDMERERYPAPEQERAVEREFAEWAHDLIVIEDANEGTALYQRLIVSSRMPLRSQSVTRDKEFRSIPIANAYRAHRVFHPADKDGRPYRWVPIYEAELEAFPNGAHDDQVDAAAGAFNATTQNVGPRVRVLA